MRHGEAAVVVGPALTDTLVEDVGALEQQLDPACDALACRTWIGRVLACPDTDLIVLRDEDGRTVAMATLATYPVLGGFVKAWLEDVVVDQTHRGRGLAQQLVAGAADLARRRGAVALNLTSRPTLAAANRFYQKAGFRRVGTNYYRLDLR
jgi:GNAT superfamily N-acetyltransferase